ncbi:MAG: hypothetical protein L6R37_007038 [Teloschistes peruensis]|nr:MAG: hypothetical protein L6R37_007038 [Teloschistes peruensis]
MLLTDDKRRRGLPAPRQHSEKAVELISCNTVPQTPSHDTRRVPNLSAEYEVTDTNDCLSALLAMGTSPHDIPQDMYRLHRRTTTTGSHSADQNILINPYIVFKRCTDKKSAMPPSLHRALFGEEKPRPNKEVYNLDYDKVFYWKSANARAAGLKDDADWEGGGRGKGEVFSTARPEGGEVEKV